jgi:hypothetical protein
LTFTTHGSDHVYIKGKVSWVKYVTPDPTYNKWSCTIHPDNEGLEAIRELQTQGVKNQWKKDEDGYYISFSRPTERKIKGKIIGMTPPVVGTAAEDGSIIPMDGTPIGNGSDGVLKLEIYSHPTPSGGKAKAARWASLRIDNLIPFNKDTDYPDPAMKEQADGMEQQPQALF